jgi:hypothetical protein
MPSSAHDVRPINDLFRPHDCVCPVVSLMVSSSFDRSIVKEVFWVSCGFHPANVI